MSQHQPNHCTDNQATAPDDTDVNIDGTEKENADVFDFSAFNLDLDGHGDGTSDNEIQNSMFQEDWISIPRPGTPSSCTDNPLPVTGSLKTSSGRVYYPNSKNDFAASFGGWAMFLKVYALSVWVEDDIREAARVKRVLEELEVERNYSEDTVSFLLMETSVRGTLVTAAAHRQRLQEQEVKERQQKWAKQKELHAPAGEANNPTSAMEKGKRGELAADQLRRALERYEASAEYSERSKQEITPVPQTQPGQATESQGTDNDAQSPRQSSTFADSLFGEQQVISESGHEDVTPQAVDTSDVEMTSPAPPQVVDTSDVEMTSPPPPQRAQSKTRLSSKMSVGNLLNPTNAPDIPETGQHHVQTIQTGNPSHGGSSSVEQDPEVLEAATILMQLNREALQVLSQAPAEWNKMPSELDPLI